jgi:hypothetical protein
MFCGQTLARWRKNRYNKKVWARAKGISGGFAPRSRATVSFAVRRLKGKVKES